MIGFQARQRLQHRLDIVEFGIFKRTAFAHTLAHILPDLFERAFVARRG